MTKITAADIADIAQKIAAAHITADRAELVDDDVLDAGGPIGYRTGMCSVVEDIAELYTWAVEPSDEDPESCLDDVTLGQFLQKQSVTPPRKIKKMTKCAHAEKKQIGPDRCFSGALTAEAAS